MRTVIFVGLICIALIDWKINVAIVLLSAVILHIIGEK